MDDVGRLNREIRIFSATVERDSEGGEIRTWSQSLKTYCAAKFLTVGSDEKNTSGQMTARMGAQFTIRKGDRVVSTVDRISFDGSVFEIDSVLPTGDRYQYLLIEAFQMGENKVLSVSNGLFVDQTGDVWVTPDEV